jgi:hypothetical protein
MRGEVEGLMGEIKVSLILEGKGARGLYFELISLN